MGRGGSDIAQTIDASSLAWRDPNFALPKRADYDPSNPDHREHPILGADGYTLEEAQALIQSDLALDQAQVSLGRVIREALPPYSPLDLFEPLENSTVSAGVTAHAHLQLEPFVSAASSERWREVLRNVVPVLDNPTLGLNAQAAGIEVSDPDVQIISWARKKYGRMDMGWAAFKWVSREAGDRRLHLISIAESNRNIASRSA